jgi:hypothetical protein
VTALPLATELHDTYCAAGDWPHAGECVAFEGYEVAANPLLTVLAGRGYARRADVPEVEVAGLTHVRSRCDAALSFGQCILPSGHAPLFGSLPHIMADGNLFNAGDVPETQAAAGFVVRRKKGEPVVDLCRTCAIADDRDER